MGMNYSHYVQDKEAGLTYKAIAFKYNIPIGTVKSRINRWNKNLELLALERKELEGFKSVS
jgi:DNA-directed RNA polymerase specialized sigma24 family protein